MNVRKPSSDRRNEILHAAMQLAYEVGPDRVTTGMIAKSLNVTQPALYRHFPSKESIWLGVAEHLASRVTENIDLAAQGSPPPNIQIRRLVTQHLELVRKHPALPSIMLMRDVGGAKGILQTRMFASMAQMRQAFISCIQAAKKNGTFAADLDEDDATALLIGIIQSTILRFVLTGDREELATDGDRLVTLLLNGFTGQGNTK